MKEKPQTREEEQPFDNKAGVGSRPGELEYSEALGWAETSAQTATYQPTSRRFERTIGIAGLVCALATAYPLGWPLATGILAGTVLGWINFRRLASPVNAIGKRIVAVKRVERGAAVSHRGLVHIFFVAVVAYVSFTSSVRGFVGFLVGLAMPVVAMMWEAVHEFVVSNGRPH